MVNNILKKITSPPLHPAMISSSSPDFVQLHDYHDEVSSLISTPIVEPNDLHHLCRDTPHEAADRLKMNITRLLINLKANNATETCIDICARDLLDIGQEFKNVDVSHCLIFSKSEIVLLFQADVYLESIRRAIGTRHSRDKFLAREISIVKPKTKILGQTVNIIIIFSFWLALCEILY
jgi:hypothetical protein